MPRFASWATALALLAACSDPARPPGALRLIDGAVEAQDPDADWLVDLGNATVGRTGSRVLTVQNVGGEPAEVRVAVPSPFAAEAEARRIGPGKTGRIRLSFSPLQGGEVEASFALGGERIRVTGRGVPCEWRLSASALDLGRTMPGVPSGAALTLENTGAGVCSAEVAAEGDGFTVRGAAALSVLPGGTATWAVGFLAQEPGRHEGALRLRVDGAEQLLSLEAEVVAGCMVVEPAQLHFDLTEEACFGGMETITVRNDCSSPVQIDSVALLPAAEDVEPPETFWLSAPFTPFHLASGASLEARVGFAPAQSGDFERTVRIGFGAGRSIDVPITASVGPMRVEFVEEHAMPEVRRVDVLVVVDDGAAFAPFVDRLPAFVDSLEARLLGFDFAIGTTTASLADEPGCATSAGGALRGAPRVIGPGTPDWKDALLDNLRPGTCQPASRHEPLEAAWRLLGDDWIADEPELLRDGSWIWILFLSASEDASPSTPFVYSQRFGMLRPTSRALPDVRVDAWRQCGGGSWRLDDVASSLGGGAYDVCADPWSAPSPLPIESAVAIFSQLSDLNQDGEITEAAGEASVEVDGVAMPQEDGGSRRWWIDPAAQRLHFDPAHRPPAGAVLTVRIFGPCW